MPEGEPRTLIETRLRVLTWNLWWRYGPWEQRLPAIVSSVERIAPDVFTMQEVWDDGERNLAGIVADALGYHHAFDAYTDRDSGVRFGNAVVSRWPIRESASQPLPAAGEPDEDRLVVHASIDGPRGAIDAFSVHLNHRLVHSHVRQAQVRAVAEYVAERAAGETPPIIGGDFNAAPDTEEIRMLTGLTTAATPGLPLYDAWRFAGAEGPGHTWDNRNPFAAAMLEPDRRIDYVFVGRRHENGAGHVVECRVEGNAPVANVWPSDHFAVLAELRY